MIILECLPISQLKGIEWELPNLAISKTVEILETSRIYTCRHNHTLQCFINYKQRSYGSHEEDKISKINMIIFEQRLNNRKTLQENREEIIEQIFYNPKNYLDNNLFDGLCNN